MKFESWFVLHELFIDLEVTWGTVISDRQIDASQ